MFYDTVSRTIMRLGPEPMYVEHVKNAARRFGFRENYPIATPSAAIVRLANQVTNLRFLRGDIIHTANHLGAKPIGAFCAGLAIKFFSSLSDSFDIAACSARTLANVAIACDVATLAA